MKAKRAQSQTAIQEEVQEVKHELQHELKSKGKEQNNQPPRKASSRGSILVDKVLEPLDALLQQWEARLNNNQTLEQRWLTYPYPEIETKRLEMCKELIQEAQALMEPNVVRALEQEVLIQRELEKQGDKEPEPVSGPKPDTILSLDHRMVPNTTDEAMTMEVMPIPEVEEPWPQSLWETIRNRKDGSATLQSAPIPEVVLNSEFYPGDIQSLYGDAGIEISMDSKPQSLKTLPSFIGEHEAKSKIRIVPSQQRATPKMIDYKGLQEMLSTPVTCTITLSELLKIRLHLWKEMGKHLGTKGIKIPLQTNPLKEEKQNGNQPKAQPVPINKVGDYCEGEEGNTTLPVEYNEVKTIAILDSGAGVAIATKQIWEKWERPALRKNRMKLQLADGYVEKPLGILEQIIVTSCGIDYERIFDVVDFGKTNNFDIILGQPFMRQLKMIQDWGYDQIYLRHKELTKAHVWMCGASNSGELTKEECILERSVTDEAYIPEPFPEHLFEPFGWTQILSTLDICVNELTPTKFCDEEGYDLVTLQMASGILESGLESNENEEKLTRKAECKRIVNEISVIDIEKRTEDKFMDSLSEDLPLLDEDFPIIKADDERLSEFESERKNIPQPEKFYDFSNQKSRRQEHYRQKRSRKSKGKQDKPMPLVKDKTTYLRMPCQKTARQWDKAPYEVDELSTNEKSHIPDEVLTQIPAHIFIVKFRDEEGDNIKTTIMPREIWTLHQRLEVASAVRAVHLEQFFKLAPWGTDYMRAHELMSSIQYDGKAMLTDSDGAKVEVLITKDIINEALQISPGAYDLIPKTKAIDNKKAFLKVKGSKFKYSDLIYSELELLLRLISQHLRVQKPPSYQNDQLSSFLKVNQIKESSSEEERTETYKEQNSQESAQEDVPKEVEAAGPSEYEESDEEDTSTPLERRSQKPRSRE
ncbi:hypothetical protein L7F22_032909 [Adiantum nelumboides]|nr:hypothetical protein [Adiantum nelumboides]